MDFIVKLGEIGLSFTYTNIPIDEKVLYLQEKIKIDTKIDIKDQTLITKKGYKLKSDDVISSIEKENNFQSSNNSSSVFGLDNSTSFCYVIYLFDEKIFAKEGSDTSRHQNKENNNISIFLEKDDDIKNLVIDDDTIENDFLGSFESELKSDEISDLLIKLNPQILHIENKLYLHYTNIKKKYIQSRTKLKRIQRFINECNNQIESFDIILKYTSQFYQNAKLKKTELVKKLKDNQEKNLIITKRFEESLENLRKIELHESLKTEKNKVLLDIYYKPEAMMDWKNNCVGSEKKLKLKIEQYISTIKSIKKKIKDERNQIVPIAISSYHTQYALTDNIILETEIAFCSLFNKAYEDYKNLRNLLDTFYIDPNDKEIQTNLTDNIWNDGKLKCYEEYIRTSLEISDKVDKLLDQINKMKSQFEQQIINIYKTMTKFISDLNYLSNDSYKKLYGEIEKVEKDFNYLNGPSLLPSAYQAALIEISRRRQFSSNFNRKYKKLQVIIETEIVERKKFLNQHGKVLPSDFIQPLKYNPPQINLAGPNPDSELPKIDLLGDENKKRPKIDNHIYEELKKINLEQKLEIQELREELQKNKENHEIKAYKKKLEDMIREFELEKEKQRALKANHFELEYKQIHNIPAFDYKQPDKENDLDLGKLRAEFEQISKMCNAYANIDSQENIITETENIAGDITTIHKMQRRIDYLTNIIQLTCKSYFESFYKKLSNKQIKYDESKLKYENALMKAEDDVQRAMIKTLNYEERIQLINRDLVDSQKKIAQYMEDYKRANTQLNDLKNQLLERNMQYNTELQSLKSEIKSKGEIIKQKDEMIKSLSDMRNKLNKEIIDLREQVREGKDHLSNFEKKVKLEHLSMLNNIHSVHNNELEKYKSKIKILENEIDNKNIEIQKFNKSALNHDKEIKIKDDQIVKLNNTIDTLNLKLQKVNEDLQIYKTKLENLEIIIYNKTNEINTLTKQINIITNEKSKLADELVTNKQLSNENMKKNQGINDLYKKTEQEKLGLKTTIEKYLSELEKKNMEIENLNKKIEQISIENKIIKEGFPQVVEDHELERAKIQNLTGELNNSILELTKLRSEHENFAKEISNYKSKNAKLSEEIDLLKAENEKLRKVNNEILQRLELDMKVIQGLNEKINEVNSFNEELQKDLQCEINSLNDYEIKFKELQEQISIRDDSINQLTKDNNIIKEIVVRNESDSINKLNEFSVIIENLKTNIKEKDEEMENLTTKLREVIFDSENLRSKVQTLEIYIKEKEDIISNITSSNESQSEIVSMLSDDLSAKDSCIMNLNDKIAEKETLICELKSSQNEKEERIKELDSQIRLKADENLKLTEENKEKEEQIVTLKIELNASASKIKALQDQEISLKEEAKLAYQEALQLRENLENLNKTHEKVVMETTDIKTQLKVSENYVTNLIKKHKLEDNYRINFMNIQRGSKILFIPYSEGIYIPFILHQFTKEESEAITKPEANESTLHLIQKNEKTIKNNFFLDLEDLNDAYQKLLKNFSLLVIDKNISYMIQLDKIEYMMGFEDDDMILKNYA